MRRLRWLIASSEYNFLHPTFWFGNLDARPLGLFRIAFAGLMLKEAMYHIFTAEMWYSDAGMLPAALLPRISPTTPSLMAYLPETWMSLGFFMLWAIIAALLLVGWHTRLMSIFNLVLLISVVNRNPLVVTGADSVMQALAFWSLFLPLGRCYSLDARRHPQTTGVFAFPVRMIQIQIALVYLFTTLFKLYGHTWQSGDALYMAMQVRMHTFPIAEWLLTNASLDVLRTLTYVALFIEGAFAILVFAPILQPYLRAIGLVAGIVLHVGIGIVMNIPNFPLVMISSYLLLIDPSWIDWLTGSTSQTATTHLHHFAYPPGCIGTIKGIPAAIGKGVFKGLLACMLLIMMGIVIWSNILSDERLTKRLNMQAMPQQIEESIRAIGLWESWALFAPDPLIFEGWFVLNGIYADGSSRNIWDTQQRPHFYVGPLARHGKLEENLIMRKSDGLIFRAWANYICRQEQPQGIRRVEIVLYSRLTSTPGDIYFPYEINVIYKQSCVI